MGVRRFLSLLAGMGVVAMPAGESATPGPDEVPTVGIQDLLRVVGASRDKPHGSSIVTSAGPASSGAGLSVASGGE